MLDKWTLSWFRPALNKTAARLNRGGITANQVTVLGFCSGVAAIPAVWQHYYYTALLLIIVNRLLDGIDGALARLKNPTDAGAYLDITLDFLVYSGIVWGFALADPERNAMAAATLIFSFIGTGSSFLAFGIMAAKRDIEKIDYPQKSFYYLGGITEGTETLLVLVAFCLFPAYFPFIAYVFAGLCWITTVTRIIGGYYTLKEADSNME